MAIKYYLGIEGIVVKVKGIFFTVVSAVLFGLTPVLARLVQEMGGNALTLTFYRNFIAIPILGLILFCKKVGFRLPVSSLKSIMLVGIAGVGLTTLLLYSSYDYIGISTATTLHFLYPVFVAILCRIFYKEKLSRIKVVTLVVATLGIGLFLERSQAGTDTAPGTILAVVSGLTYGYYMMDMEKKGLSKLHPILVSFYMASFISGALLVYNIAVRQIVFLLPPKAYLYIFIMAVCTSFLAVALLQVGIQYLSATTAAIFCLFEPVTSNIAGVLFLNETLSVAKVIGSIIILGAAAALAILDQEPQKLELAEQEAQQEVHLTEEG
ncbi:MAG: DMT family transporter [Epulopiscium sp.]|nr:DMT family transporter [Candidatus Epulonipiscium sp.]